MNLSAPFIRRPVMTTFIMLSILIAGWLAYLKLPVSDLPPIEKPNVQVTTGYTGANAEAVLNLVTIPLEKELTRVKGVQEIKSISSPGYSKITLSFSLNKNMDQALRDIQTAISRAEKSLPPDIDERPTYQRDEGNDDPIMYMVMTSETASVPEMRTYADTHIMPRLSRIEGVSKVIAFGSGQSIWVKINPELMAARGVGFNEIISSIKQYTTQLPLGSIQTSNKTLDIELSGTIQQAKDLGNIEIGSSQIRIKDIAEISDKASSTSSFHFITPEKTSKALILAVQKINDGNTVAISKNVHRVVNELQKELPSSIHLNIWLDKAVWIHESLLDVEWSLLIAFILVVIVIYLSLGKISEAFIPTIALPISLVGTLAAMYLLDFSLDLLSLLALTLSVGFVVDDAIVVLENIVRHQEKGESAKNASLIGSKEICFTIVSMTLSLVAVFIPLLFMPGINGRLFREFSVTLAIAILVSGFVSLTLTPLLCSRLLPEHATTTNLQRWITSINNWCVNLYGKSLQWCLSHQKTVLLTAISCIAITVPLFTRLPVSLIPPEDRSFIIAAINLPSGLSSENIQKYQSQLEPIVQKHSAVENFLDISFEGGIFMVLKLYPLSQRQPQQSVIAELQKEFNEIPGIMAFLQGYQLINIDLEFGHGGQYKYLIKGNNFPEVQQATNQLVQAMQTDPTFSFVQSSEKNDTPKLIVTANDALISKLGFTKQDIQRLLQKAYGQGLISSIQKGPHKTDIFMELQKNYQNSPDALAKLYLTTNEGQLVPLKALASWQEHMGTRHLRHHEQFPSNSIRFSLKDDVSPQQGMKKVEELAQQILPNEVTGFFHGSAQMLNSTTNTTLLLLLAAAIVMYIVLGILYESFVHPITILSSIPFAGLGGIITLFLFNEPISIFSAVGFLLLIGIVKKNGIMMVDYAIEAQKQGVAPTQAIYDACLVRFRPIMMTTAAAIMGAIPIAIGFGDDASMRRGLGLVIVGGLLFSQLLTLYITPIIYIAISKLRFHRS